MVMPTWTTRMHAQSLSQRWKLTLTRQKKKDQSKQKKCTHGDQYFYSTQISTWTKNLHIFNKDSRCRSSIIDFNHLEPANLIDPSPDYARYMEYLIIHLIYKSWTGYAKWLELLYEKAKEMFDEGKRHDALGSWGHLAEVDPATGVSREVSDEEVLEFGRNQRQDDDPTGTHLLNRLRTNQLISQLLRGAIQLGYHRQHFTVENHVREGQTLETPMVQWYIPVAPCCCQGSLPKSWGIDSIPRWHREQTMVPTTCCALIHSGYACFIRKEDVLYSS